MVGVGGAKLGKEGLGLVAEAASVVAAAEFQEMNESAISTSATAGPLSGTLEYARSFILISCIISRFNSFLKLLL